MSKTLLNAVRAVAGELGFSQTNEVMASPVLLVNQIKQLAIAAGDELLDAYDWQRLLRTHVITTVGGQDLYDLPTDYHRMVNNTMWDTGGQLFVIGDVSPMSWQDISTRNVSPSSMRFRLIGNQVQVYPAPPASGLSLAFNYISNSYVVDGTSGLTKTEFSLDSDSTVYHDRMWINLTKLKLLQVKNFDTRAAVEDFNSALSAAKSSDVPAPILSMDPQGSLRGHLDEGHMFDIMVTQ